MNYFEEIRTLFVHAAWQVLDASIEGDKDRFDKFIAVCDALEDAFPEQTARMHEEMGISPRKEPQASTSE